MTKKRIFAIIAILICNCVFFSLSVKYPLVDIDQAKSDLEVKIESETQDIVPPAIGMIKEIEVYGGVQKYLYVGLSSRTRGLKIGLKGYIYNDPQLKEKVGKAVIIEIYSDIVRMKILETSYKVNISGVVAVEVDPRKYIE